MSTHSPHLIKLLPPNAIKVLRIEKNSGYIFIEKQSSHPGEAFFHLGDLTENKKTILVEDKLAEQLINRIILSMGEAVRNLIEVKFIPGGAISIWNQVKYYAAENRNDVLVYLDGDQEPKEKIPDPKTIPESKNENLHEIIKSFTNTVINFSADGNKTGKNVAQFISLQREFIGWSRKYVHFLPGG